jgi:Xaa-Pro aminopeptidase
LESQVSERLQGLRQELRKRKLDAYIVPSSDPHQSEYTPVHWQRRAWISGFTGSAGDVVVTAKGGGLWTDGRYFIQAERELAGSGLALYRMGEPGVRSIEQELAHILGRRASTSARVGVDSTTLSANRCRTIAAALADRDIELVADPDNLVDVVRGPIGAGTLHPVSALARRFTGLAVAEKLELVRAAMRDAGAHAHIVTTLDAIAWLFNLRGRDVAFNPVFVSYAIVTRRQATLFVDLGKIGPGVRRHLGKNVRLRPYEEAYGAMAALADGKQRIWVDPDATNAHIASLLGSAKTIWRSSPIARMKARKNTTELEGMRRAHVRDGVAMVRFLAWLDSEVSSGRETEVSIADRLEQFRAEGEGFRGLSFPTIAGYAAHGAIIHYSASAATAKTLQPKGLLLLDSGAQYLDGTTDITRTLLLGGRVTRHQRQCYTRVLKGHIALARAHFPKGTTGARLDTLARHALWQAGLDFGHGTGHGVGCYLNVHEGPQSISPRSTTAPLEVGNIQSNEPGYYEPGKFGIRIENLVEVVAADGAEVKGDGFMRFDTLTLCPIDVRPLERKLLEPSEVVWLNAYHRRVHRTLAPLLDRSTRRWLKDACRPL